MWSKKVNFQVSVTQPTFYTPFGLGLCLSSCWQSVFSRKRSKILLLPSSPFFLFLKDMEVVHYYVFSLQELMLGRFSKSSWYFVAVVSVFLNVYWSSIQLHTHASDYISSDISSVQFSLGFLYGFPHKGLLVKSNFIFSHWSRHAVGHTEKITYIYRQITLLCLAIFCKLLVITASLWKMGLFSFILVRQISTLRLKPSKKDYVCRHRSQA